MDCFCVFHLLFMDLNFRYRIVFIAICFFYQGVFFCVKKIRSLEWATFTECCILCRMLRYCCANALHATCLFIVLDRIFWIYNGWTDSVISYNARIWYKSNKPIFNNIWSCSVKVLTGLIQSGKFGLRNNCRNLEKARLRHIYHL